MHPVSLLGRVSLDPPRELCRQACLAHASGPGQRDEPLASAESLVQLLEERRSAHQGPVDLRQLHLKNGIGAAHAGGVKLEARWLDGGQRRQG
jgi:hypothetical protein